MASNDLFLRSDVDKGETSPDKDLRLRSDADKSAAGPTVVERTATDAIVMADTLLSHADRLRLFQDSLVMDDILLSHSERPRIFRDNLLLADAIQKQVDKFLLDAIPVDDVSRRIQEKHVLDSVLPVVDLLGSHAERFRLFQDSLVIADALLSHSERPRIFRDNVLLPDAIQKQVDKFLLDAIPMVDLLGSHAERFRTVQDFLLLNQPLLTVTRTHRQPGEDVLLSDQLQKEMFKFFLTELLLSDSATADKIVPGLVVVTRILYITECVFNQ